MIKDRIARILWSVAAAVFLTGLFINVAGSTPPGDHWACFDMPDQCCVRYEDMPSGGNLYVCHWGYEGHNCENCGWSQE